MTTRFFSLILLCITSALAAQNLVPNHSFEEFVDGCPETFNGTVALGWERWANSPDLFSTCIDPQDFNDSLGWAPWNGLGYQWPADGESYAGLFAFSPSPSPVTENDYREYIGCELIQPLEVGETYYVSFKTSMGFTGNYYNVTYACNRLGAYFTTQSHNYQDNPLEIPNEAQIFEENIVTDTTDWIVVSGSFQAVQPYTHMGLGVFFDFDSLNVLQLVPGLSLGSYYFIDDICVSRFPECDGTTFLVSQSVEPQVKVFPNPANEFVTVESNAKHFAAGLYNLNGRVVIPNKQNTGSQLQLNVTDISDGIYLLEFKTATQHKRKKLVVVH